MFGAGQQTCGDHSFNGYAIRGTVIPATPTFSFEFLAKNILRADQYQTIDQLLEWSRSNLSHFLGAFNVGNADHHWQYRGLVPPKRIINKTTLSGGEFATSNEKPKHWIAGCHGTTSFYRTLLRTANIPVDYFQETCDGHILPVFWTIDRALSHGDDPYSSLTKSTPPAPAGQMMISTYMFLSWFVSDSEEAICNPSNVARAVQDYAIEFLPDVLLKRYCSDVENRLSRAEGELYEVFKLRYSVAYLESKNLWGRAAIKADQLGYCPLKTLQTFKSPWSPVYLQKASLKRIKK
jgi:hypothetical protein